MLIYSAFNKTGVGDPPPNADQNETENKYKDKPRKRDDLIRIEFKKSTFLIDFI